MPIIIAFVIIISGIFVTANVADKVLEKQIRQGSQPTPTAIQEVQTPSPSPSSTPTLLPSFTPVPKPMATSDPDPYIKCRFKSGVKELRKSQCDSMIDCQVGENWVPSAKEDCNKLQQANRNNVPNNQSGTVNCETQSGWVRMSQDECKKVNAEWANQLHEELNNQFKIQMYQALEQEAKIYSTLDQLDNLRERIRHIQTSSPAEQEYANTIIRFIEERIKILQQQ